MHRAAAEIAAQARTLDWQIVHFNMRDGTGRRTVIWAIDQHYLPSQHELCAAHPMPHDPAELTPTRKRRGA